MCDVCDEMGMDPQPQLIYIALSTYGSSEQLGVRLFSTKERAIVYKQRMETPVPGRSNISVTIKNRFLDESGKETAYRLNGM